MLKKEAKNPNFQSILHRQSDDRGLWHNHRTLKLASPGGRFGAPLKGGVHEPR